MALDLSCLLRFCVLCQRMNRNKKRKGKGGTVNWIILGMQVLEAAKPYIVQYVGEVAPPTQVNVDQAFQDAEGVTGFKPYEAPTYDGGNVRALLIGINYYGTSAQLSGCVNDVRQELATFQKTGFPVDEMAILVDEKGFPNATALPTRANIIRYMAWLVKDAKAGDVLFMHYSGHGTQAKSNDPYEEYDQVICPMDYQKAGCIIDDNIFDILGRNLPTGVRMTVLFDCCHSGSMMDLPYAFVCDSSVSTSSSNYHMRQIRQDNYCAGDVLMISGCADTQTSADVGNTAALGNGTKGAGGAATQCLTYTLLNTKNLSYKDTLVQTRLMLKKKRFEQIPQLSSSKPLDLNRQFSLMQPLTIDATMARSLPAQYR